MLPSPIALHPRPHLISEYPSQGAEVRRTDESGEKGEYRGGGDVERLSAPHGLRSRVGVLLLPLMRRYEGHDGADEPGRRGVVTKVGQKVVVQLPEDVQRNSAVGRGNVVICLSQQSLEVHEDEMFG